MRRLSLAIISILTAVVMASALAAEGDGMVLVAPLVVTNPSPNPPPTPTPIPTRTPSFEDIFGPTPSPKPINYFTPTYLKNAIVVDGKLVTPSGNPGDLVRITLPLLCKSNTQLSNIIVKPIISTDIAKYPFEIDSIDYTSFIPAMTAGSRQEVSFDFRISDRITKGYKNVDFLITYTAFYLDKEFLPVYVEGESTVTSYIDVLTDGKETSEPHSKGALVLESAENLGEEVNTPQGDIGDTVTVELALRNRGGALSEIEIAPNVDGDPTKWPFDITSQNYTRILDDMASGDSVFISYDFTINMLVKKGAKPITFTATYKENGKVSQSTFSVFVNVINGAPDPTPTPSSTPSSQPKLILRSYNVSPTQIFAGQGFDLEMTFMNTSSDQAVSNVSIGIQNADAMIMPAPGGSNTVFIKSLKPGASEVHTLKFTARPDAPTKAHQLNLAIKYEGKNATPYTETEMISVPIMQKIRMVVDEPRISAEAAYVGTEIPIAFNIVNQGKALLYNIMVKTDIIDTDMTEAFFGGNLNSGATLAVDISVISQSAGLKNGEIIVYYEDEYGTPTEKRLPATFTVMEQMPMPEFDPNMPVEPEKAGLPLWAMIAIGVGSVVILIIIILIIRRAGAKKRERELDDDFSS